MAFYRGAGGGGGAVAALKDVVNEIIKIQDKGSKVECDTKLKDTLDNPLHYEKLGNDPSKDHVCVISLCAKKWLERGQIMNKYCKLGHQQQCQTRVRVLSKRTKRETHSGFVYKTSRKLTNLGPFPKECLGVSLDIVQCHGF